jgi:histidinol-phosphate aminotransferase
VEEGLRELGLDPPGSQANFSWVPLAERDEGEVIQSLGRAGIVVRGGEPLGGPGHLRVTYGTRAENQRFLDALAAAI